MEQEKEFQLSDMLCARARVGPARYLKFDSNSMTLGEWSNALVAAIISKNANDSYYAPPWLALAALQRLGFEQLVREPREKSLLLFGRKLSREEIEDYRVWAAPAKGERRRPSALIIIGESAKAKTKARAKDWPPSSRYAVIVLSIKSGEKLAKAWQRFPGAVLNDLPVLNYVAVEMPAKQMKQDGMFPSELVRLSGKEEGLVKLYKARQEQRTILIFPERPPFSERYHAVTAEDLDEFFFKARSQPREVARSRFEFRA